MVVPRDALEAPLGPPPQVRRAPAVEGRDGASGEQSSAALWVAIAVAVAAAVIYFLAVS